MKTIVFGASGFIGSHIADALSDAGHEVVLFDLKESRYRRPGQTMALGSILEPEQVLAAMQGCDFVYHFAGIADLDDASTKPLQTAVQNVQGTVTLLEAARQAGIRRFVYASSLYVYSNKGGFYRCSKQAAELYVEEYQRQYGLEYTVLRFGTVYGPRADRRNSVYRYLKAALSKKKIVCSGTGDEFREYVHVRDAAQLAVQVLEPRHANQRVIITGQHRMRFRDFLNIIREIFDFQVEVVLEPSTGPSTNHYNLTPYSFVPRVGYKLTSEQSLDIGQGLLECLHEIADPEDVAPQDPGPIENR